MPDGVVCYNNPVAAGALKAILEAGLRVPEGIAVIGAGNVHYSDLLRVSLSAVDQNSTAWRKRSGLVTGTAKGASASETPNHFDRGQSARAGLGTKTVESVTSENSYSSDAPQQRCIFPGLVSTRQ
jgi:hypothetical protein